MDKARSSFAFKSTDGEFPNRTFALLASGGAFWGVIYTGISSPQNHGPHRLIFSMQGLVIYNSSTIRARHLLFPRQSRFSMVDDARAPLACFAVCGQ